MARVSISGHERNHLFFNSHGDLFSDLAGISGLDHPGDSRSFAIWDYDRDGWQDIAIVNVNAPLLQLYRNQIGSKLGEGNTHESIGRMVALRFVGGNHTSTPQALWSNRDGYGAMVTLKLGEQTLIREHRAGEGLAAQNSATLIIGIGQRSQVDSIVVRWPSGMVQQTEGIAAGTLVTVYEDPSQQPDGQAFVFQPYKLYSPSTGRALTKTDMSRRYLHLNHIGSKGPDTQLRLYTTMATWCAACQRELPQLQHLRALFDKEKVAMFGVPIDDSEDTEKLKAYRDKYQPAYELLLDLGKEQAASVQQHVKDTLKMDGLPATIITDSEGYVLRTMWGVPSASEIHQLLADLSL